MNFFSFLINNAHAQELQTTSESEVVETQESNTWQPIKLIYNEKQIPYLDDRDILFSIILPILISIAIQSAIFVLALKLSEPNMWSRVALLLWFMCAYVSASFSINFYYSQFRSEEVQQKSINSEIGRLSLEINNLDGLLNVVENNLDRLAINASKQSEEAQLGRNFCQGGRGAIGDGWQTALARKESEVFLSLKDNVISIKSSIITKIGEIESINNNALSGTLSPQQIENKLNHLISDINSLLFQISLITKNYLNDHLNKRNNVKWLTEMSIDRKIARSVPPNGANCSNKVIENDIRNIFDGINALPEKIETAEVFDGTKFVNRFSFALGISFQIIQDVIQNIFNLIGVSFFSSPPIDRADYAVAFAGWFADFLILTIPWATRRFRRVVNVTKKGVKRKRIFTSHVMNFLTGLASSVPKYTSEKSNTATDRKLRLVRLLSDFTIRLDKDLCLIVPANGEAVSSILEAFAKNLETERLAERLSPWVTRQLAEQHDFLLGKIEVIERLSEQENVKVFQLYKIHRHAERDLLNLIFEFDET